MASSRTRTPVCPPDLTPENPWRATDWRWRRGGSRPNPGAESDRMTTGHVRPPACGITLDFSTVPPPWRPSPLVPTENDFC